MARGAEGVEQMQTDLSGKVRTHFGWMLALNPRSNLLKPSDTATDCSGAGGERDGEDESEKKASQEQQEPSKDASTKYLALLPDSRSRALWLAFLLDEVRVQGIVEKELQQKLSFLDSACMNELAEKCTGEKSRFSEIFCSLVLEGLKGTHHSNMALPSGEGAEAAQAKE